MCQPDERLVLLAKEPRPGLAKTRLAADVGAEAAHALATAFIDDTFELMACAVDAREDRAASVAYTPADARAWFELRASAFTLLPQRGGDLGERIQGAFADAFAGGAERVVVMGMDTPHLPPGRIDHAFEELRGGADLALGPTEDGGYYLIGLTSPFESAHASLFKDVPWSTSDVLGVTQRRAREASLGVALLPETFDVDDGADLERLRSLLLEADDGCRVTRRALTRQS
ncbi:MAG: TIGR04282 family arsenosugar biosynthesis glycosyltransferase [Planctomycetota bacterium]